MTVLYFCLRTLPLWGTERDLGGVDRGLNPDSVRLRGKPLFVADCPVNQGRKRIGHSELIRGRHTVGVAFSPVLRLLAQTTSTDPPSHPPVVGRVHPVLRVREDRQSPAHWGASFPGVRGGRNPVPGRVVPEVPVGPECVTQVYEVRREPLGGSVGESRPTTGETSTTTGPRNRLGPHTTNGLIKTASTRSRPGVHRGAPAPRPPSTVYVPTVPRPTSRDVPHPKHLTRGTIPTLWLKGSGADGGEARAGRPVV